MDIVKKSLILENIAKLCPNKRRTKYSNEYYLNKILLLHNVINNWRNLALFCPSNKKGHYTTILKKFHTWTKA